MLEVQGLTVSFSRYRDNFAKRNLVPVHRLDLNINNGETVSVVGESGGGKSLLAHAILGMLPDNAKQGGKILFKGKELDSRALAGMRGREIALVPQSVTALNPLMRTGKQIKRAAILSGLSAKEAEKAVDKSLERFNLSPETKRMFPFQLSGGMAQRVLIAMATVGGASLIIADEPTTGLDPERLSEVMTLLRSIADEGRSVMMITHDLEAAREISDSIAVFCAGTTVEIINNNSKDMGTVSHPYSKALWRALPSNGFEVNGFKINSSLGSEGYGTNYKTGCPFSECCTQSHADCSTCFPALRPAANGLVRCINA